MSHGLPAIADYGLIGDTRSAALVSRAGAIDWLCWPRFDSPALFLAILDSKRGGACTLAAPQGEPALRPEGRRYLPGTNILETTLATSAGGRLVVTDFMPVHARPRREVSRGEESSSGAEGRLVRRFVCTEGEVVVQAVVRPAFDYGRASALLTREGREHAAVFRASAGPTQAMAMLGSAPLTLDARTGEAVLSLRLRAGGSGFLVLTEGAPGRVPALDSLPAVEHALADTLAFWEGWSARCTFHGPYREAVLRSLLVLKALTYVPTGGIVAAPTLGLPEAVGGVRNYDYRYSWPRDASFTVRGFLTGGYFAEANAYLRFLTRNAEGDLARTGTLRIFYGLTEPDEPLSPDGEEPLEHLAGFGGSRPVSVGNAARDQAQHDIYGDVLNALGAYVETTGELPQVVDGDEENHRALAKLVRGLVAAILACWREPDRGVWETRGPEEHFFHSKALCWVGLDRAVKLADRLGLQAEAVGWAKERDAVRADYLEKGWNAARGAFTQAYGSPELDAAVLRTVLFGALEATDPRVEATLRVLLRELGTGPAGEQMRRYRPGSDSLPRQEGSFTACGFWVSGCLALAGRAQEAQTRFEQLLAHGNDLGLFSEEVDPATGAMLGNFPQAFTHMSIVNGAKRLQEALERGTAST